MSTKLPVTTVRGEPAGELDLPEGLLVLDRGRQAVKDAVVASRAARRGGDASTKTRGEVAGSGKKPWRQKGTGRARAGSRRSPIWRGGGAAFGPRPRDYASGLNRKVRALAFGRAFSERIAEGAVTVLDSLEIEAPKTRQVAALVRALGSPARLLVVAGRVPDALRLAARNHPGVEVATAAGVQVYEVLRADRIAVARDAWERLEARLRAARGRGA